MTNFPEHIILPDRVYVLSFSAADPTRAFLRDLIDFRVEGINPLDAVDEWKSTVGMERVLRDRVTSLRLPVPLEWILIRFLCRHLRAGSLDQLSGNDGKVLERDTLDEYLGQETTLSDAEMSLRAILSSWVRFFPETDVALADIFASLDAKVHVIKQALNTLRSKGDLIQKADDRYAVLPSILPAASISQDLISFIGAEASGTESTKPGRPAGTPDEAADGVASDGGWANQVQDPGITGPWVPASGRLSLEDRERLLAIKSEMDREGEVLGESNAILRVFKRIHELNERDNTKPLVLLGQTGVGKTFLVPLIVASSKREGKWEEVNAQRFAGGDFNVTKGELLGFAKGYSFHGVSLEGKVGLLEHCKRGTIFIDELAKLSHEMQTLLLTILDGAKVQKVGDLEVSYRPEVRFIFATNRDPLEEVANRTIEHDLWRRLCRYCVTLPSLRERKEDIPLLARSFLGDRGIEMRALLALMLYEWSGNVAELKTVLDNLPKREGGKGKVDCSDLPDEISSTVGDMDSGKAGRRVVAFLTGQLKDRGFEHGKGLNKEVARLLGVSPATVSNLLKQLEM